MIFGHHRLPLMNVCYWVIRILQHALALFVAVYLEDLLCAVPSSLGYVLRTTHRSHWIYFCGGFFACVACGAALNDCLVPGADDVHARLIFPCVHSTMTAREQSRVDDLLNKYPLAESVPCFCDRDLGSS